MARFFSLRGLFGRCRRSSARPARQSSPRPPHRPALEQLESRLAPATTLSIADSSVIEPGPHGTVNMDFTVTRSGDLTSQVTVGYTTVAGTAQPNTDFTPQTGTTTFAPGSATATIAIPIFGNGVYNNPNLTFSVQLTGVTNVVGPPVSFANQATLATGSLPISVAVGDVNGDGKPDLIVANVKDDDVSVLLNTTAAGATTASFASQQTFATGSQPFSVAVADLNGDGKADLVVANYRANDVSVLLNTTAAGATTASFASQQTFATGTDPISVAVGDLNGDGKPDLVVANYGANDVSVLLNTTAAGATTASFASQQTFASGAGPVSVAVADLNGDGRPDLVVANHAGNEVSVLLNTTAAGATTASFASQQTFATGSQPISVAVADLNGDGRPDLVVANYRANDVSVLLNTTVAGATTASFAPQQTFATGTQPFSVAVADLNGDGKPDLVAANYRANDVSVLLNTTAAGATTASFAPQQALATGSGPRSVALGDVNGDGRPDLVVANLGDGTVSVLLNTTVLAANGASFAPQATAAVGSQPLSVAVGDLNGDGKPDLVVANAFDGTVSVLLNETAPGATTPSFATQQTFAVGNEPFSVALGDVNGDGKPDVIVANEHDNSVSVLVNTTAPGATTASFATQQIFPAAPEPYSVALADLNGDGKPDLVFAARQGTVGGVSVLLNETAPGATTLTFATPQGFVVGGFPSSVAVGDLNGDGKPDIVTANERDNTVSVLLNETAPGATMPSFAPQEAFAVGKYPQSVALGDLNGDGKPDLVAANSYLSLGGAGTVSVLLNEAAPGATTLTFATQQTFAVGSGSYPRSVALGDVNGDGKPDLVVANHANLNDVSVLVNETAPGATMPSFATQQTFAVGSYPASVALGDLNGDGRPDLAVANEKDFTVSVLLNTPVTISRATATGTITESDPEPTVQFASAGESVNVNAGTFTLTVTLSAVSGDDTTVPFTLGGTAVRGTDYSNLMPAGMTLDIPAGRLTGTITGTLLVPAPGPDRTIVFTLGTPTNATPGSPTTNTLLLAQPNTLSIGDSSAIEPGPGGTVNMNFTVTRTGDLRSQVTVGFTTVAGTAKPNTDFTPTASTVTFAAGSPTATIAIPIFGNGVYNNPSLTFSVQLTGVTNVVGPPVSFANQQTFAVGSVSFSVAVGDLNGDGKPDLVVANRGDGTVSVLLNTTAPGATTPSFAAQQTFAAGGPASGPASVALADLNGDGKPDLVVANSFDNDVSVLRNETAPGATSAAFASPQTFAVGNSPFSVVVGDLNGDGKPDIVVANTGGDDVSVLVNATAPGATTLAFAPQQTFAVGGGPFAVALGDLNGDGQPDLVVANANDNTVSVLVNKTAPGASSAAFASQQTFAVGSNPQAVAVGDVNGDGKSDLVIANINANTVSVLLNATAPGATTLAFASQQPFAVGTAPQAVAVGDVNGDGKPDLVVANEGDNTVSVLVNKTAPGASRAAFASQQTFAVGNLPFSVALGDLNGDGRPDLITANETAGTVSVLLNTTVLAANSASFAPQATAAVGTHPFSLAAGDLNGDGKPDLVVANLNDNTLSVLLNTTAPGATTPSFAPRETLAVGNNPLGVAIGDVNGDGRPDLLVTNANDNTVGVLLNQTAPGATTLSFATQQTFAVGTNPIAVAPADVNGDGRPDLVVANFGGGSVSVLLNQTAPGATALSFASQQPFAATQPRSVAVGDVNGDGRPDLVVTDQFFGTVTVLLNQTAPGATTLSFASQQTFATGSYPHSVALADVNGDGRPDIVIANENSPYVSVLLNATAPGASTASFSSQQTFAAGNSPASVAVGDVNGDGRPDLVVANRQDGTVSVLRNQTAPGATTLSFATQQTFAAGSGPYALALSDLNGDGRPDLAVANYNDGTVSVLLNAPVTLSRAAATGTITESDPPPTVQFATAGETEDETDGTFSITVTLSAVSGDDTTIPFTVGGTAVLGTDYTGVTASPLVIPAGRATATITGTLLDDGPPDVTKTLTFTLGTPTNGTRGSPSVNTLTIGEPAPVVTGSGPGMAPLVNVYAANTGKLEYQFFAFELGFTGGVSVAVGDVNGDGTPDVIVAAAFAGGPRVRVLDGTRLGQLLPDGEIAPSAVLADFFAYSPAFTGGVTVAVRRTPDGKDAAIVTGTGVGSPHVKVIDANKLFGLPLQADGEVPTGALLASFFAYAPSFTGGVSVAVGDVNKDGTLDVVTGAGPGGGPQVNVVDGTKFNLVQANGQISNAALRAAFFAYSPNFSGGVNVALGDVNADGTLDVITAPRTRSSLVQVLDGTKLGLLAANGQLLPAAVLDAFFAYDPATFGGGVTVSAGDANDDGTADLLLGTGVGTGRVKLADGSKLHMLAPTGALLDAALLYQFFAYGPNWAGGVYVGTA